MKTKLALAAATLIIGVSSLNASTTGALTKATVKLIKENQQMISKIEDNEESIKKNSASLDEMRVFYKESQVSSQKQSKELISVSKNNDKLSSSVNDLTKSNNLAIEDRKVLHLNVKDISKRVKALEDVANISSKKIKHTKEFGDNLRKDSAQNSQKLEMLIKNFNDFKINQERAEDRKDKELRDLRAVTKNLEAENKILKDKLSDYKAQTDAKIKVIDAKASKKPLKIIEHKSVIKPCDGKKCANSSDDEETIKRFLAN